MAYGGQAPTSGTALGLITDNILALGFLICAGGLLARLVTYARRSAYLTGARRRHAT